MNFTPLSAAGYCNIQGTQGTDTHVCIIGVGVAGVSMTTWKVSGITKARSLCDLKGNCGLH